MAWAPSALRSRVENTRSSSPARPVDQATGSSTASTTSLPTFDGNMFAQVVPRYEP